MFTGTKLSRWRFSQEEFSGRRDQGRQRLIMYPELEK